MSPAIEGPGTRGAGRRSRSAPAPGCTCRCARRCHRHPAALEAPSASAITIEYEKSSPRRRTPRGTSAPAGPGRPALITSCAGRSRPPPAGDAGSARSRRTGDGVGELAVFGGEFHRGSCRVGWIGRTWTRRDGCRAGRPSRLRAAPRRRSDAARASPSVAMARHSASTRRVSRGSMMPSSHRRAVPNTRSIRGRCAGAAGRSWPSSVGVGPRLPSASAARVTISITLRGLRAAHHRGAGRSAS